MMELTIVSISAFGQRAFLRIHRSLRSDKIDAAFLWLRRLGVLRDSTYKTFSWFAYQSLLFAMTAMLLASQVEAQVTPSNNAAPPLDADQFQIQQRDITLVPGGTQQFSTIGLASGVQVKWQVNGKEGGDSIVGLIDDHGLFSAPTAVPPVPLTITAFVSPVSMATSTITIAQPVCSPANGPCIRIRPSPVVPVGGAAYLLFVPKNGRATDVEWFVNNVRNGNASLGNIQRDGSSVKYIAPRAVVSAITISTRVKKDLAYITLASSTVTLIDHYISVRCYGPDVKGVPKNNCNVMDFDRLRGRTGTIAGHPVDDDATGNGSITSASWVAAINSSKALVSGSLIEITFPNSAIVGNCKNYDWKIVTQTKESANILIYNPSDVGSGVCVDGKFLIALPVHVLWADVSGFRQFADPSRSAPVAPSSYTDCFGQPAPETIMPCDRYANWRIATLYKLADVQRLFGQSGAAQGTISLSPVIGSGARQLAFDVQADPAIWVRAGWINAPITFQKSTTAGSNLDAFIAGIAWDTRWVRKPNFVDEFEHFKIRKPQLRMQTGTELAPTTPHDVNVVGYGTVKIPVVFTFHQQPSALTVYPMIGIEGGSHVETHLAEPDPVLRGVAGVDGSFRWPYNVGHSFLGSSPITIEYSYRMRWLAYAEPTTNPAGTGTEILSAGRRAYARTTLNAPFTSNFQFQTTLLVGSLPPNFRVLSPTLTFGLTFNNPGSSEH